MESGVIIEIETGSEGESRQILYYGVDDKKVLGKYSLSGFFTPVVVEIREGKIWVKGKVDKDFVLFEGETIPVS